MTAGEKINFYRKKLGLSQEELGQKLLVSRQTISLWEKGQTVPTIDNLIRLKEIFGVSVDEILGCAIEAKVDKNISEAPVPNEKYRFNYSKKDIDFIYRNANHKPLVTAIVWLFVAVIGIFLIIVNEGEFTNSAAFVLGVLSSIIVLLLWTFGLNLKNSKNIKRKIIDTSYEYNVYEDYFTVNIEDKKSASNYKFRFDEIERFLDIGEFLLLFIDNKYYMLRKQALDPKSIFTWLAKSNPEKTVVNKKGMTATKIFLNILFIVTLFSLFIPLIIMSVALPVGATMPESLWIFYTAIPIPLASIILGVIYKRKGYKCKKNIVTGIIMLIFMCIFGSAGFSFENIYDHTDAAIIKAEETIGIEIPEAEQINTQDYTIGEQSVSRGYIYSSSDIYFEDSQVDEFEKEIQNNSMWLSDVPSNLIGITSPLSEHFKGAYSLIYNVTTKEFNTLPQQSGTYRFYCIRYHLESNSMQIDEYDIEYIK